MTTHARPADIVVPGSISNLGPGFDALSVAVQLYLRARILEVRPSEPDTVLWEFDGAGPALHIGREFPVDGLEGPLGRCVSGSADAVKNAASCRLFFRFMAQKGVFERDMFVLGNELHSFFEPVAR